MTEKIMEYKLILGDCLHKLKELEDNSIDSIVTDPPYGISFMGKKWDYDVPSVDIWKECYRILKPGGHLLSFSSPRTYHRMAVNVEDAGFEIRDQIMWVYGSGFPKSHNVGKAIDKKLGNERKVVGISNDGAGNNDIYIKGESKRSEMSLLAGYNKEIEITKGTSQYEGWGTALKPAHEPIVMARKPFKGDVCSNVLEYGTGAINIDACKISYMDKNDRSGWHKSGANGSKGYLDSDTFKIRSMSGEEISERTSLGRWPANFIHNGSEEEWSKFFYCPKASKKDRNEGCEELEEKQYSSDGRETPIENAYQRNNSISSNSHPTVKPTDLMRYLCRLVTPKNGTVLDPFMGSGSTGKAAIQEGYNFIGIELSEEYLNIAEKRIKHAITKNE